MATTDETENKTPAATPAKRGRKPAAPKADAAPKAAAAPAAASATDAKPAEKPKATRAPRKAAAAKSDKPAARRTPAKARTGTRSGTRNAATAKAASAKPQSKTKSTPSSRKPAKPAETASSSTARRTLSIFSIGAAAVAVGAALVEGVRRLRGPGNAEHSAPDLALDRAHPGPDDRAPEAFRPDPTAAVPAGERDALRPATMPLGSGRELDSVH